MLNNILCLGQVEVVGLSTENAIFGDDRRWVILRDAQKAGPVIPRDNATGQSRSLGMRFRKK